MGKSRYPANLYHPRYWPTRLGLALFWLIGQLPWNLLLACGRGLGHLAWYLAKSRRQVAETNIRLCFPELSPQEQLALAKASVVSTGEAMLEMAGSFCNQRIDLAARLSISGIEHIEQAQADGKGVLLLGMHFNSIDVGSRLLGKVLPINAVYRPNDNPLIDKLINEGRGPNVDTLVERSDIRQMVRLLRKQKIVWYAPDQDYGTRQAVFVPFFGVPAATITATSRIARMSRPAIIPVAHYRLPGGHYQIEFGPPLANFPSGDDEQDCTLINSTIEQYVRKYPEQYLWVHRRFKHQPDNISPYPKKKKRR